jgi:hypothetical protein
MGLKLEILDDTTRQYMLREIEYDLDRNLFPPKLDFLTEQGGKDWEYLMRLAVESYDSDWLGKQLEQNERTKHSITKMVTVIPKRKPGQIHQRRQNTRLSPTDLADSEFNRLYIRAVCQRAIDEGKEQVQVYRAKSVKKPASNHKIGQLIFAQELLDDLRENIGKGTRLGIPSNPRSGISVRLFMEEK